MDGEFRLLYKEVYEFYHTIHANVKYGWSILRGPPVRKPPVLFVGLQGGYGGPPEELGEMSNPDQPWPQTIEYLSDNDRFSRNMRIAFGEEFLARCAATNAIVFKAPNERTYRAHFRDELEDIRVESDRILTQTIRLIAPQTVVVIGFTTFGWIGADNLEVKVKDEITSRWLMAEGELRKNFGFDGRAYVTFHFSGARGYTDSQRKAAADAIKMRISGSS